MSPHLITWTVAALATAGVIVRPFNLPEAIWAVAGAVLLVVLGLISIPGCAHRRCQGHRRLSVPVRHDAAGRDRREEGLFDWLAAVAASHAEGSARRLFLLTYGVGTVVTIFLSNDATAVVLTPAVAAAVHSRQGRGAAALSADLRLHRQCGVVRAADFQPGQPRHLRQPHAAAAAMVAGLSRCPRWSSIAATYLVLRWTQRGALGQDDRQQMFRGPGAVGRRQDRGDRDRGDGHRASRGVGVRYSARVCPRPSPAPHRRWSVLIRERKAPWRDTEGYILGRAAARRRPVRAGRGARTRPA